MYILLTKNFKMKGSSTETKCKLGCTKPKSFSSNHLRRSYDDSNVICLSFRFYNLQNSLYDVGTLKIKTVMWV